MAWPAGRALGPALCHCKLQHIGERFAGGHWKPKEKPSLQKMTECTNLLQQVLAPLRYFGGNAFFSTHVIYYNTRKLQM